jgi:hypothetical protein
VNIDERNLAGGTNITRGRSTPMEMHFLKDPIQTPALTATKKQRSGSWKVRVITVAAIDGRDCATLRREQLDDDDDIGLIPWEVEAGECPMWKTTDHIPNHKYYRAQWKSLLERGSMLKHY